MALIEIDGLPGFTVLKNGWIFPWRTVTNHHMVMNTSSTSHKWGTVHCHLGPDRMF